jgi:hypothetical protein
MLIHMENHNKCSTCCVWSACCLFAACECWAERPSAITWSSCQEIISDIEIKRKQGQDGNSFPKTSMFALSSPEDRYPFYQPALLPALLPLRLCLARIHPVSKSQEKIFIKILANHTATKFEKEHRSRDIVDVSLPTIGHLPGLLQGIHSHVSKLHMGEAHRHKRRLAAS